MVLSVAPTFRIQPVEEHRLDRFVLRSLSEQADKRLAKLDSPDARTNLRIPLTELHESAKMLIFNDTRLPLRTTVKEAFDSEHDDGKFVASVKRLAQQNYLKVLPDQVLEDNASSESFEEHEIEILPLFWEKEHNWHIGTVTAFRLWLEPIIAQVMALADDNAMTNSQIGSTLQAVAEESEFHAKKLGLFTDLQVRSANRKKPKQTHDELADYLAWLDELASKSINNQHAHVETLPTDNVRNKPETDNPKPDRELKPDDYAGLVATAKQNGLTGIQLDIIEAIKKGNGSVSIADAELSLNSRDITSSFSKVKSKFTKWRNLKKCDWNLFRKNNKFVAEYKPAIRKK